MAKIITLTILLLAFVSIVIYDTRKKRQAHLKSVKNDK